MKLNEQEKLRYSRHILLNEIGETGVEQLRKARALVVGAGGLGAVALYYLAAAGVGTIGIIDGDKVDITNLQRQIIHFTDDVGKEKVLSAAEKIKRINPAVKVETYPFFLTEENGIEIISIYDYILECTDSHLAKLTVNDLCVQQHKPFTQGSAIRFEGRCMTITPGSACYRCLYPQAPEQESTPDASHLGVLSTVAGTIGTIQAVEAIKYLTGTGELLTNRILLYDALTMSIRIIRINRNTECICSPRHTTS